MGTKSKADLLILGNVITMDEHKPYARAVAVKDDKIIYVGAAEVAKKLCDDHTQVCDYGNNSVYPGFLEAHCHPGGAGGLMSLIVHLDPNASLEECVQVMKDYMEAHPDPQIYIRLDFRLHLPLHMLCPTFQLLPYLFRTFP